MSLESLIAISRHFGGNPEYILAGGGNTSWKEGHTMYVKASGMSLADADRDSFAALDRRALALIWEKRYPESSAERESAVLADMTAALITGGVSAAAQKRPSVETLLHDLLPFAFAVHLHPALVNGVCCSRQGESAINDIFADDALWIASCNPGYELAKTAQAATAGFRALHGKAAAVIFMQNHGVFAAGACVNCIKALYSEIMQKIGARVRRRPDFSGVKRWNCGDAPAGLAKIMAAVAEISGGAVQAAQGGEFSALLQDRAAFAPVASPFTPDHIVYAGSDPLFVECPAGAAPEKEALQEAWASHVQAKGRKPKIIAVQGEAILSAAPTEKAAGLALDLFKNAVEVSVYADSFGGPLHMDNDKKDFINNWEAESYRLHSSA